MKAMKRMMMNYVKRSFDEKGQLERNGCVREDESLCVVRGEENEPTFAALRHQGRAKSTTNCFCVQRTGFVRRMATASAIRRLLSDRA